MTNKPLSADDLLIRYLSQHTQVQRDPVENRMEAKRHLAEAIEHIIGKDLSLIEYRPGFVARPDTETAIQIEGKDRHNELLAEQRKRLAEWLGDTTNAGMEK